MAEPARRHHRSRASDPATGTPGPRDVFLQRIDRCALFASLPEAAVRRILAATREQRIARGDIVFSQGGPADAIYLLTEGRVKLFLNGPSGRAIMLGFVDPGDAFGCLSHLAGTPRIYTAQAVGDSIVLGWKAESFDELLARHPAIMRNALRAMARQVQSAWTRLHHLATEPVARRAARALLASARPAGRGKPPVVAMLQQDLAELLGTTPPTLSRILGQWEGRGFVAASRERVAILRPHELVRLAEPDDAAARSDPHRS